MESPREVDGKVEQNEEKRDQSKSSYDVAYIPASIALNRTKVSVSTILAKEICSTT